MAARPRRRNKPPRRQHQLPAVYLGALAADHRQPSRDRTLFCLRRGKAQPFKQKVNHVSVENDVYTLLNPASVPLVDGDEYAIEKLWGKHERQLSVAIGELRDGSLSARTWAQVLVPFVCGLLVRGPQYKQQYDAFLGKIPGISPDNANNARLMRLQRLLAPVMAARWLVLQATSRASALITNDLGYIPMKRLDTGQIGYAIPVASDVILCIVVNRGRNIASLDEDGQWRAVVEYESVSPRECEAFNHTVAAVAQNAVYGPTMASVLKVQGALESGPVQFNELFHAEFGSMTIREYDEDWHGFISAIELPSSDPALHEFQINPAVLGKSTFPVIYRALNRESRVSGLVYRHPNVQLCIADVDVVEKVRSLPDEPKFGQLFDELGNLIPE
ncbi:DUF4238 domain-containing protein [Lentzea sp. NPDC006480]|uniref:DUF4238 domain-containing protein n=1 Tax=Lentzea sp. NPDC006480 TaxID=3157176 RepID=UPI0033A92D98